MVVVLVPPLIRERRGVGTGVMAPRVLRDLHESEPTRPHPLSDGRDPIPTYDRVVRIVTWAFILATSTIVAVPGLWRESQAPLFVLLALAGLFVLVVHDVLPAELLGQAK